MAALKSGRFQSSFFRAQNSCRQYGDQEWWMRPTLHHNYQGEHLLRNQEVYISILVFPNQMVVSNVV